MSSKLSLVQLVLTLGLFSGCDQESPIDSGSASYFAYDAAPTAAGSAAGNTESARPIQIRDPRTGLYTAEYLKRVEDSWLKDIDGSGEDWSDEQGRRYDAIERMNKETRDAIMPSPLDRALEQAAAIESE